MSKETAKTNQERGQKKEIWQRRLCQALLRTQHGKFVAHTSPLSVSFDIYRFLGISIRLLYRSLLTQLSTWINRDLQKKPNRYHICQAWVRVSFDYRFLLICIRLFCRSLLTQYVHICRTSSAPTRRRQICGTQVAFVGLFWYLQVSFDMCTSLL